MCRPPCLFPVTRNPCAGGASSAHLHDRSGSTNHLNHKSGKKDSGADLLEFFVGIEDFIAHLHEHLEGHVRFGGGCHDSFDIVALACEQILCGLRGVFLEFVDPGP